MKVSGESEYGEDSSLYYFHNFSVRLKLKLTKMFILFLEESGVTNWSYLMLGANNKSKRQKSGCAKKELQSFKSDERSIF